jgi:GPH family glycoside/pentoside/hexuronide:cation symporter
MAHIVTEGNAILVTNTMQCASVSSRKTLSKRTLLIYGSLALPLSLAEIPILLYLPAFYAQELGLSAGLIGVVFLSARLWDGLSDVLTGWLSDRSTSRWGRRKPWVVAGAPFLVISTWFLCNPPRNAGVIYLSVWAGLFYTAFTAVKIPHLSWGTELSSDYGERSRVTAFRETFTMLGNLLFVSVPMLVLGSTASLGKILFLISIAVLLLTLLAAIPLALCVRDPAVSHRTNVHLLKGLMPLAKDRVFIRFAIATLLTQISNGIGNSLAVFSFSVGLQLPDALFKTIFILYIATLAALPPTMLWARRAEKHRLLAGATALYAVAVCALLWAPMRDFPLVAALWAVAGIATAAMSFLPTSMLADIIDGGEVATGEHRSGAYVAIFNLAFKVGLALGVGVAFGLLELVHYDPAATHHSGADAWNIRLLAFALPALLCIPAVFLYLKHPITRKVQRQLREQIKSRRNDKINEESGHYHVETSLTRRYSGI